MSQDVLSVIASFFGSLGFAIIYNIRGRRVWIPAIGGAVFWAVYLVFLHFVNNEYLGFFVVAILITIYSEIWARILKTPASDTSVMPVIAQTKPQKNQIDSFSLRKAAAMSAVNSGAAATITPTSEAEI